MEWKQSYKWSTIKLSYLYLNYSSETKITFVERKTEVTFYQSQKCSTCIKSVSSKNKDRPIQDHRALPKAPYLRTEKRPCLNVLRAGWQFAWERANFGSMRSWLNSQTLSNSSCTVAGMEIPVLRSEDRQIHEAHQPASLTLPLTSRPMRNPLSKKSKWMVSEGQDPRLSSGFHK